MTAEGVVLYEPRGPAAWITLNRPDKLNALSAEVVRELRAALGRAAADDEVKVVILTGAGRAFSAGYDISEEAASRIDGAEHWRRVLGDDVELTLELWSLPKPTIAAVRGWCLAGACELAIACDLVVAAEEAKFIEVFVRRGIALDAGGAYLLMRRIGIAKAKELVFLGDDLPAREAERIGLINRCVPLAELESVTRELAGRLAQGPTFALGMSKRLLNRSLESDLETAFSEEAFAQSLVAQSQDIKEGMRAFMEKRSPQFKGK